MKTRCVLSFLTANIIIVAGLLGGFASSNERTVDDNSVVVSERVMLEFPRPLLVENDMGYFDFKIGAEETYLMSPGKPMLPRVIKTFELPFGVKNIRVQIEVKEVEEKTISGEITPCPAPMTFVSQIEKAKFPVKDVGVYSSDELYPKKWYSFNVGCGLNSEGRHTTFLNINLYPVRYAPMLNKIQNVNKITLIITYEKPENSLFPVENKYDLVIISPAVFSKKLRPLIEHKNVHGVKTTLKTTQEIYNQYPGRDKPEKIKYFIKDAVENWGVKYVLLVGGLRSRIYAKPRDDVNHGARGWYLPVRYSNLISGEPGYLCDLYYGDIYKYDDVNGYTFDDWDSNGNDVFAEWPKEDEPPLDILDLYPDVAVGRLACRNSLELKNVVDKIINYETKTDPSWFKKIIVVSGDGFLDQHDLNIQWDTRGVQDGRYTIYAQSVNVENITGPVDQINITVDKEDATKLTFNHDDHLNPALQNGYPAPPITEIVSVSPGDVLGYTDYTYTPGEDEAYCNDFNPWANISYVNGVLTIRGKSYDPEPYGNVTNVHVWVKNMKGEVIFSEWRNNTETYYEGEWTTGEKLLCGRGGALYYMPSVFKREILWASNGNFTGQDDVLSALNRGCGFLFMSGHGSPNVWADHFPGVPGNRKYGSVTGLRVTSLQPWKPFMSKPLFPIDTLSNGEKLPVAVIGGCHNSMFNVSMVLSFYDIFPYLFKFLPKPSMWSFGVPAPECFSWRLIRNPHGGAIASMGNTGLGYGMPGKMATVGGGDSWITIEFFKQYGAENHSILGESYTQALVSYIHTFDMSDFEAGHPKTVEQWVLFGDPSLKIGGYSS